MWFSAGLLPTGSEINKALESEEHKLAEIQVVDDVTIFGPQIITRKVDCETLIWTLW